MTYIASLLAEIKEGFANGNIPICEDSTRFYGQVLTAYEAEEKAEKAEQNKSYTASENEEYTADCLCGPGCNFKFFHGECPFDNELGIFFRWPSN